MAEENVDPVEQSDGDPFASFGGKAIKPATDPFKEFGGQPVKKKVGTPVVKSTLPPSPVGGQNDPNFLGLTNNQPQTLSPFVNPAEGQKLNPHAVAINRAKQNPPKPVTIAPEKKDSSIFDDISEALYIPAINKGFSDLVIKPAAGATDFIDRTIDKAYQAVTGDATPDWLRKKGAFHDLSNWVDKGYEERRKPTNIVSETAEGVVGTLPLMASMFTGQGEASLAAKTPQFISHVTKLLATTGALNAYKDATDKGEGYVESLGSAAKGGAEGGLTGLTLDAQMLVGGALGKGVANKLAQKGLLKGGKAGEAILHALSVGSIFGGTAAGEDLLNGRDIDTHNVAKQFGMGLAFEALPVAKALGQEVGEHIEKSDLNKKAAQTASLSSAASNLNAESAVRTLMQTPVDQIKAINENIKDGHEDLYANSIEQGAKAYDEKNVNEKRALYADQLLLKTQADVKLMASKIKANPDEFVNSIQESTELEPQQKQDLLEKVQALTNGETPSQTVEEPKSAPTQEQILDDLKNKRFSTFTYEKESDIPEELKGRVSSTGEINGKKTIKVTLTQSEAEYILSKNKSSEAVQTAVDPSLANSEAADPALGAEEAPAPSSGEIPTPTGEIPAPTGEIPAPTGEVPTDPVAPAEPNNISINEILDKPVKYKGEDAKIVADGQTLVAKIKNSNREYELGNIDEIGDSSIKDHGVEHVNSVVDIHENGNLLVRGKEVVNNYSDPTAAINYDKEGNILSVNLETPEGQKRTFKGDVAEDLAYQIHLKELHKNDETREQFEQFVEQHEPSKSAIVAAEDAIATEKGTVENNETVSRKPAKKIERPKIQIVPKAIGEDLVGQKETVEIPVKEKPVEPVKEKPVEPVKEKIVKVGDPLRKFASKVREGKISKLGGFKTGSLFDTAWDGSLEAVATAIEGGAKLADAIDAGLKHIRETEWYKSLQEKDDFENQYRAHLEKEAAEKEATTTLRNADVEAKRAEYGFQEPVPRKGTTDAEFDAKADEQIKAGVDAHELMDKVLIDKKPITGVESVILSKYQGTKEAELLDVNDKIEKATDSSSTTFSQLVADRDRVLEDLQRAYDASEASGTVASDALRARKVRVAQDTSLAGFLVRERMQVNKGEKLSQEQIKVVSDEYKDIQEKNEAYQKKIAELQEQLKTVGAEKILKRVQEEVKLETRRNKRSVKVEQLDKDIEDTFAALKKIAREKRGTLSANPIPVEYLPELAKLVKLYTQKGATTLTGIVDELYHGLKDDIEGLTKDHVLEAISNLPEATKKDPLKAMKSRLKSSIRRVQEKTEAEDFTPTKKNKIVLDEEALKLRDELNKARYDYEVRMAKDMYAKRTPTQKFKDGVTEVFNIPMALLSSLDFSAPLRQGLVPTISHPMLASGAIKHMFEAAFSNKAFNRWFYDLKEAEDYQVMKDAKLYIADPHKPELVAKEEAFMSNLAEKIPLLGPLVKGSEQAYVGYLNKLRVDLFRHFSELYTNDGKTPANSPELYKGLANYINNATGRGNFVNESVAQSLNGVIFSPRLVASRFNLLMNPRFYASLPKQVRIQAATDMVKFVSVGLAVLAIAKANGAQVEVDPRSADFAKIKFGDTRYDIFGGFSQYVRLVAGIITGQTKNTGTGDISDPTKKAYGAKSRWDKLLTFSRSKLAPVPGFVVNSLDGEDAIGKEFNPVEQFPKLFIPLVTNDIVSALKDGGVSAGLKVGIPSMFGVGVQTYSDLKPPKQVEPKASIEVANGTKYKLTEPQLAERKKYNDEWLAKHEDKQRAVYLKAANNDPELKMEIATKSAKYRSMGQDKPYIDAHRQSLIDNYVTKKLSAAANKYSKMQMLKKYRGQKGQYNLEKSEE